MPEQQVRIELEVAHQGRKRFRGLLLGAEGTGARIRSDDAKNGATDFVLAFDDMADARLVLTDDLIAASLRRGKSEARAARRGRAAPSFDHDDMNERRASGAPAATETKGE